ncbi:conserved hypothetical protein [Thermotomaculum hydrothermale]|uniref:Uncharacterized protein n=1 Tax=Thermotomaculum hydrothermale TaxID=981385 RepID=A0A7R6PH77_9BACT|nr:hypothetical protein [Thermotomaculum hydrothermale]BBB32544.1 conserved hypothetical protein [Thermotomaculum hydrothermale]
MTLSEIILITFVFNIVCGLFRVRQTKLKWKLLYIHLPIPLIACLRISSGISWKYIPLLVIVAVLGQMAGGKANKVMFPGTMPAIKPELEEEE